MSKTKQKQKQKTTLLYPIWKNSSQINFHFSRSFSCTTQIRWQSALSLSIFSHRSRLFSICSTELKFVYTSLRTGPFLDWTPTAEAMQSKSTVRDGHPPSPPARHSRRGSTFRHTCVVKAVHYTPRMFPAGRFFPLELAGHLQHGLSRRRSYLDVYTADRINREADKQLPHRSAVNVYRPTPTADRQDTRTSNRAFPSGT